MNLTKLVCVFLVVLGVFAGTATSVRSTIASRTTMMAEGTQPPPPPWKPHVA